MKRLKRLSMSGVLVLVITGVVLGMVICSRGLQNGVEKINIRP